MQNERLIHNESGCFETLNKDLLKNMDTGEERFDDTTKDLYNEYDTNEKYIADKCK